MPAAPGCAADCGYTEALQQKTCNDLVAHGAERETHAYLAPTETAEIAQRAVDRDPTRWLRGRPSARCPAGYPRASGAALAAMELDRHAPAAVTAIRLTVELQVPAVVFFEDVVADHPAEGAAYQDIGGEMLLPQDAGEADSGRHAVDGERIQS